jgi:hypothetical protein
MGSFNDAVSTVRITLHRIKLTDTSVQCVRIWKKWVLVYLKIHVKYFREMVQISPLNTFSLPQC